MNEICGGVRVNVQGGWRVSSSSFWMRGVRVLVRRHKFGSLTHRELQIMQVLWQQGPSCVREVQEGLKPSSMLAYTTVQTMLNVLQRKRKVKRLLCGRSYEYRVCRSREEALNQAVRDIVQRMCNGSWDKLLASVITARELELEQATSN